MVPISFVQGVVGSVSQKKKKKKLIEILHTIYYRTGDMRIRFWSPGQ